jgi:hypothetical protein
MYNYIQNVLGYWCILNQMTYPIEFMNTLIQENQL